jgi:hypothetical protein
MPDRAVNAQRSLLRWVQKNLVRGLLAFVEHGRVCNLQRRALMSGDLHDLQIALSQFIVHQRRFTMLRSALTTGNRRKVQNAFATMIDHVSDVVRSRLLVIYGKRHHLQRTLWRGWAPWLSLQPQVKAIMSQEEEALAAMRVEYDRHVKPILNSVGTALCLGSCMTLLALFLLNHAVADESPPPMPPSLPPSSPPTLILRKDTVIIHSQPSSIISFLTTALLLLLLLCLCLACIGGYGRQQSVESQLDTEIAGDDGIMLARVPAHAVHGYAKLDEDEEAAYSPPRTNLLPVHHPPPSPPPPVVVVPSPPAKSLPSRAAETTPSYASTIASPALTTARQTLEQDIEDQREHIVREQQLREQKQLQQQQAAMQQRQLQLQAQQAELMKATAAVSSPTAQERLQDKQIAMHETQIELQRQQNELLRQQLQQSIPSPPSRENMFSEDRPLDSPLGSRPARSTKKAVRLALLESTSPRRASAAPLPPTPSAPSTLDPLAKGFGTGNGFGMSTPRFSGVSGKPPASSARKASPQSVRKPSALSPRQPTSARSSKPPEPEALQTPRARLPPPPPATRSPPRATPGQETMKSRYRALNTHPERKWGEQRRITVAPHQGSKPLWIDGWNYGSPHPDPDDPASNAPRKGSPRRGAAGSSTPSPRQSPRASPRAQSPKPTAAASKPWF